MVRSAHQDLLQSCHELRLLCSLAAAPGSPAFEQICALTHRIESSLQLVLEERMDRFQALVRARTEGSRDRRTPGQRGRRASDREASYPG